MLWQCIYNIEYFLKRLAAKYIYLMLLIIMLSVFASVYFLLDLQHLLDSYCTTHKTIEGLQSLILNIGSALIGATAIVASLVLFAMQTNIERMPYGLFQRLSSDIKLLSIFASAFFTAVGIATLSVFKDVIPLTPALLSASFATIFILFLFVVAYRRALILINPLQQLKLLLNDTRKELRAWARRAQRAIPLIEANESGKSTPASQESTHDTARTIYFYINNHWTDGAKRSIRHAMSFARRYSENGDHEVSGAALTTVVNINAAYIAAKGKTFYATNPFFDSPFATDGLVNDTLESLRQNVQGGISRRDEQQIEQTFQTMTSLVRLYLSIDYSTHHISKTHALLAAGYLSNAVQAVVPHNMADVLIEGLRLMGQSAQYIIALGKPNDIVSLCEKIALISCTGYSKDDHRPVTTEGMTQLADVTYYLLRPTDNDIHFAVENIRKNIVFVVKLFLKIPNTPLSNTITAAFGPYYSSTSMQSLRIKLTALAKNLAEAQADNIEAQQIIRNIERWADGLYETEKELLLAAINEKSHFVFDMIYWITGITEILLAVSNAPACTDHTKEKIQKHALWLISTFTWIPDNEDSVAFVENFQMTELIFEAATNALTHNCEDIAKNIGKILLSWSFKVGIKRKGWHDLAHGLCGLAALALMNGCSDGISWIKTIISTQLSNKTTPTQEVLDNAAEEMLNCTSNIYANYYSLSQMDRAIAETEREKMDPLLVDIAKLLSPDKSTETRIDPHPTDA